MRRIEGILRGGWITARVLRVLAAARNASGIDRITRMLDIDLRGRFDKQRSREKRRECTNGSGARDGRPRFGKTTLIHSRDELRVEPHSFAAPHLISALKELDSGYGDEIV